ncbi:hypothetical protein ENBRE01_0051 [Enteropsectra breve]|nr:hypothetical protein ENBRE01_0051 [Enteropsectra breve]
MQQNDQTNIIMLLDSERIEMQRLLPRIAHLLGLAIFSENGITTMCNDNFVLDIFPSHVKLIFVLETNTRKFAYIERYLNFYFANKKLFFFILRCFARYEAHQGPLSGDLHHFSEKQCCLAEHKTVCNCIFGEDLKITAGLYDLPENFNIFTHKTQKLHSICFLLLDYDKNEDAIALSDGDTTLYVDANIASHYSEETINISLYHSILNISPKMYYSSNSLAIRDGCIYQDGNKKVVASLFFSKGASLKVSLSCDGAL